MSPPTPSSPAPPHGSSACGRPRGPCVGPTLWSPPETRPERFRRRDLSGSAGPPSISGSRRLRRPLGHLIRRDVLHVRRDVPVVSKWIFEASRPVPVELVFDRAHGLGAGFDRAFEDAVRILD